MDFPIAEVSTHAAREVSIRHGHLSSTNVWLMNAFYVLRPILHNGYPYVRFPEQHPTEEASRRRLLPGTLPERAQPSLEDLYSPGDWVFDACLIYEYGRILAVRNSDMDVDFGHYTSTLIVYYGAGTAIARWEDDRTYMRIDDLEKVAGPESETPGESSTVHPESDSDADVYVSLDVRHGMYSGSAGV